MFFLQDILEVHFVFYSFAQCKKKEEIMHVIFESFYHLVVKEE